jgi:histone H3/H4
MKNQECEHSKEERIEQKLLRPAYLVDFLDKAGVKKAKSKELKNQLPKKMLKVMKELATLVEENASNNNRKHVTKNDINDAIRKYCEN